MPACNKLKLHWVSDQLQSTLMLHLSLSKPHSSTWPAQATAAVPLQASMPAAFMDDWEHALAAIRQCSRLGTKPLAASATSRSHPEWWLPSSWLRSTGQTTSVEPWHPSCCAGRKTLPTGWVRLPFFMVSGRHMLRSCMVLTTGTGRLPQITALNSGPSAKGTRRSHFPHSLVAMVTAQSEHTRHCPSQPV